MNDCKTRSGRAFDRQAWTYDTARFGSHARGLYPVLLEQLAQIPHGSVLDVGCGTGELLREVGLRFPETARTGLDLSANMLAVAREKLGGAVELVQGDAERLPFADGRFEVLLCNDSFHHYPNPGAAAAEFARVLQPGGVLAAAEQLPQNAVIPQAVRQRHLHSFSARRTPRQPRRQTLAVLLALAVSGVPVRLILSLIHI